MAGTIGRIVKGFVDGDPAKWFWCLKDWVSFEDILSFVGKACWYAKEVEITSIWTTGWPFGD